MGGADRPAAARGRRESRAAGIVIATGAAAAPSRCAWNRGDPGWPARLDALRDAPTRLRIEGRSEALQHPAVAIVGARAATAYGLGVAHRLAGDLARAGVVVVSGLARGIDAAAHQGALDAGGLTVAVLPGGLDRIVPVTHRGLAAAIAGRGALVSERADDEGIVHAGEYLRRNRLIAALADACVVVEAGATSGALATARIAERIGRPRFAVPGDVDRPTSLGTCELLRAGARPCAGAADVLAVLGSGTVAHPDVAGRGAGPGVAGQLDATARTVEDLAARAGVGIEVALSELLALGWAGLARRAPGGRWRRAGP